MRRISLSDGTSMGDELLIFETNAPINRLKELEKECCDIYKNGGDYDDIPIWEDVLTNEGYTFNLVASHQHVTPFLSSNEWMEENYKDVKEHYVIENQ